VQTVFFLILLLQLEIISIYLSRIQLYRMIKPTNKQNLTHITQFLFLFVFLSIY